MYVIYHILFLFILDLPGIHISHSNLTVIEGDQVTAICNGSGSPLPEVDWPVNSLHSIYKREVGRMQTHNAHPYSHQGKHKTADLHFLNGFPKQNRDAQTSVEASTQRQTEELVLYYHHILLSSPYFSMNLIM